MENQKETTEQKNEKEGQLGNYFQYVLDIVKNPDGVLVEEKQGKRQFGLITLIVFLALVVLTNLVGILEYLDALSYFEFSDYFNYFERAIAYGAALALVLFMFKNTAEKNGQQHDVNFFIEKLGALLVIPSVLLLISIPLDLLDITMRAWVASLGYTFLYLSIFLISYLYIAKNNLKTALLFVAGFYFVYRIIYYVL